MPRLKNTLLASQRGSTLVITMGLMLIVSFTAVGILSYTGAELARTGRVARSVTARNCAEAGIQYGRLLLGRHINAWDKALNGAPSIPELQGMTAPDGAVIDNSFSAVPTNWGTAAMGRMDGRTPSAGFPPDFLVSIKDDFDEVPPNPLDDNNLQLILRSECVRPGSGLVGKATAVNTVNDPTLGTYRPETSSTRRNIVIEARIMEVPPQSYQGQSRGGSSGGPGAI